MLRLFRNYLCLVTVLQLGTAVQAQQNSVTAKPVIKPAPVTSTLHQPAIVTSKSTKTIPPAIVTSKPTPPAESKTKSTVTVASPVKSHTTSTTTPGSKAIITTTARPGQAAAAIAATSKSTVVTQVKHSSSPRPGLVPPPPPDTPTIFAGEGMFPGIGAVDFNNPAALAARRKDIASQLASAKKLLADKEQRTKELKDKVIQFQSLYSEGVISRRELETTQKEADSTVAELNDAKTQTTALQNTLARLDDRLKPKSLASSSKKKVKGKIKAALKPSVKVAGSSSLPAGKPNSVVSVKETTKDSGAPVVHSSENMDSELSATSTKAPTQADLKH